MMHTRVHTETIRSFKIAFINTPWWFHRVYTIVQVMLSDATRNKIKVFGAGKREVAKMHAFLLEYFDKDKLPPEFGGTSGPLGTADNERACREYVDSIASTSASRKALQSAAPDSHRTTSSSSIMSDSNSLPVENSAWIFGF